MRAAKARGRLIVACVGAAALVALMGAPAGAVATAAVVTSTAPAAASHASLDCRRGPSVCTEVANSEAVFGKDVYVGHDEPSLLFYSNTPGSGNQMRYDMRLPSDPPANPLQGKRSYNFMLNIATWFGMAMCDVQSYPELVKGCTPDSDVNIVDPAVSPYHPGTAFMEMQFYPPGFAPWPSGNSCSPTQWCAALNIDSLSQNALTGKALNDTCTGHVGGSIEYVNFAFITRSGKPHATPNPVDSTLATFTPNRATDLFMSSGDDISVTLHDTSHGLQIALEDRTSGDHGSMTTSAANGFGMVKFAPNPSTECTNIPYDFHPMYSTSSEQTRVPWAAHSYNIAFDSEIGHFDYCTQVAANGTCTGLEGRPGQREPAEPPTKANPNGDDAGCFGPAQSLLVRVGGCLGTNTGFDGMSYQRNAWPDGKPDHPTPTLFSSPLTGANYDRNYGRVAFETNLPRVEFNTCDRFTGSDCTLTPVTDDNQPAAFYPFFSTTGSSSNCRWAFGNHIPGVSTNDFGQGAQYGRLLNLAYTDVGGAVSNRYNDFRQILPNIACPSTPH